MNKLVVIFFVSLVIFNLGCIVIEKERLTAEEQLESQKIRAESQKEIINNLINNLVPVIILAIIIPLFIFFLNLLIKYISYKKKKKVKSK